MADRQQKERAEELYAIACFYTEYGFHADAIIALVSALSLDSCNKDVVNRLFWYFEMRHEALTEEYMAMLADSIHAYVKSFKGNEITRDGFYVSIAELYANANNCEMAYYYFEKAKNNEPDNPEMYIKIACLDSVCKRYDNAIIEFDKALSLDPACHLAYYMKSITQMKTCCYLQAKESLEMFMAVVPKDDPECADDIQRARNMLAEINEIAAKTACSNANAA